MAFTYPALDQDSLRGLTIIDLTRLFPGPFCTQLFSDLGARVIKVEPLDGGDYARWYPPTQCDGEDGYGEFFASVNRGKLSIAVDMRKPEGLDVLRALLRRADVLVEGFRPGVMEKWGLGVDELANLNAQLIVCRITGYGQDGPDALAAGHDLNYIARSGALGAAGMPGVPPLPLPFQVADLAGGALYAAFGIMAGLYRRVKTHHGCFIDVSMTEGAASLFGPARAGRFSGPVVGQGLLSGANPCYRCYLTSDARIVAVAALEPKFWSAFCLAMQRPDWMDAAYDPSRAGELESVFAAMTSEQVKETFAGVDACTELCRTVEEVLSDTHLRSRGAIDDERGCVVPPTSRMASRSQHVPRLGEHTRLVLRWAGTSDVLLSQWHAAGAIAEPGPGGD